jgi:catechol 2,3-dioxygenase-like lactoylglutathione lyase family enzyme
MTVELDHLIVFSRDKRVAAAFLADVLGLPAPNPAGKFVAVRVGHGLSLDFADAGADVVAQHYAFAVSDVEFDAVIVRIRERRLPYWADPQRTKVDQIADRGAGSRAVYFADPSGHWLEVLTRATPHA